MPNRFADVIQGRCVCKKILMEPLNVEKSSEVMFVLGRHLNIRYFLRAFETSAKSFNLFDRSVTTENCFCVHRSLSTYSSYPPIYLSWAKAEKLREKFANDPDSKNASLNEPNAASEEHLLVRQFQQEVAENSVVPKQVNDEVSFDNIFNLSENNSELVGDGIELSSSPEQKGFRKPVTVGDQSDWLVLENYVPEIKGIDVKSTKNLIVTNFVDFQQNALCGRIPKCNEQNLNFSDYATLATSVDNCDLYLTLEVVFLVLQISPGGIHKTESSTQQQHLVVLVQKIVEKFAPKYLVILSPFVPASFQGFIGQSEDSVVDQSLRVIDVIANFISTNPTIRNSTLIHYPLNEAFKVNGNVSQELFFDRQSDFRLSSYGYSMLESLLNMIHKSLYPKLRFASTSFEGEKNPREEFTRRSFNQDQRQGYTPERKFGYRPRDSFKTNSFNRDQGYDWNDNDEHRPRHRKNFVGDRQSGNYREVSPKYSRYGVKSHARQTKKDEEKVTSKESDRLFHFPKEGEGSVAPYRQGEEFVWRNAGGVKSGFQHKFKVRDGKEPKARSPYQLDYEDENSFKYMDTERKDDEFN